MEVSISKCSICGLALSIGCLFSKSITSAHHYYGKHYRAFVDNKMREKCKDLLEEGGNLRSVAQMQGKRSLTETERVKYEMAELIKTDFLFQDG